MKTHLMYGTREYNTWGSMKARCSNKKNPRFNRYGGRGISVCERWSSFDNFFADMGNRPEGMTLDRINNDGDYEPSNCRWATTSEQLKNTSRIRHLTLNGETLSLVDWAKKIGVKANTLTMRLNSYGWSVEKALSKGGVF